MKFIRIGLTTGNFASALYDFVHVKSDSPLSVSGFDLSTNQLQQGQLNSPNFLFQSSQPLALEAKSDAIAIIGNRKINQPVSLLVIKPENETGKIIVSTDKQFAHERIYNGELVLIAVNSKVKVILKCLLDEYVKSVIKAEMPATYQLEAIKAQAVCARTYALHPRVNHQNDLYDVCDSYLCCQAFSGWLANENPIYLQACNETAGQVIIYKDEPILSLFSACAGGHTENYEDCFSDWGTGIFPPPSLPYLRGVSENTEETSVYPNIDEVALKKLWHSSKISTFDSWSPQFRWSVHLSIEDLESIMHHRLSQLLEKKEFAPFIISPPSRLFGSIHAFSIGKRGVGGTAIELTVSTSKGNWQLKQELVIRNLFKNKNKMLERLPSAKIFFDHVTNHKKQLQSLVVCGLGHGHGVGMQQVGAQGMAKLDNSYEQILNHYYSGVQIENT